MPDCEHRYCGDNGCGGTCGDCGPGLICETQTSGAATCARSDQANYGPDDFEHVVDGRYTGFSPDATSYEWLQTPTYEIGGAILRADYGDGDLNLIIDWDAAGNTEVDARSQWHLMLTSATNVPIEILASAGGDITVLRAGQQCSDCVEHAYRTSSSPWLPERGQRPVLELSSAMAPGDFSLAVLGRATHGLPCGDEQPVFAGTLIDGGGISFAPRPEHVSVVTHVTPPRAVPGKPITLSGSGLGPSGARSATIDGEPLLVSTWTDNRVKAVAPDNLVLVDDDEDSNPQGVALSIYEDDNQLTAIMLPPPAATDQSTMVFSPVLPSDALGRFWLEADGRPDNAEPWSELTPIEIPAGQLALAFDGSTVTAAIQLSLPVSDTDANSDADADSVDTSTEAADESIWPFAPLTIRSHVQDSPVLTVTLAASGATASRLLRQCSCGVSGGISDATVWPTEIAQTRFAEISWASAPGTFTMMISLPAEDGDETTIDTIISGTLLPGGGVLVAPISTAATAAVEPPIAALGSTVSILGHGFGDTTGTVLFNNFAASAEVVSWSDTAIQIRVPDLAASGAVEITTADGASLTSPVLFIAGSGNDDDDDGINNSDDLCPRSPSPSPAQADEDGDGIGDACDADRDGDAVAEIFARLSGTALDSDGDMVPDAIDNCPGSGNSHQLDLDTDGLGDACDPDIDGDGESNQTDAFPLDSLETADTDGDGVGDNADTAPGDPTLSRDSDGDGVADEADNCPTAANSSQTDTDSDGSGDPCDADANGDGVLE